MKNKFLITILFVLGANSLLYSQVTIAPTNLFINDNERFGTFLVINNSNENQEISVEFFFSAFYFNNDGNREFINDSTSLKNEYSINEYLKAFPRNFTLTPGQRQVVRIRVNPTKSLSDGTYWSRIKTISTPQSPPVELSSDENVTARVGLKIEQITGLYYKKGDVNTSISVEQIETNFSEDTIIVSTKVQRGGNSPFLGTITANLLDQNDNVISQKIVSTTIFFDGTIRQEFNLDGLNSGEYKINVNFRSQRGDISSTDIVQIEPETATTTVTIP